MVNIDFNVYEDYEYFNDYKLNIGKYGEIFIDFLKRNNIYDKFMDEFSNVGDVWIGETWRILNWNIDIDIIDSLSVDDLFYVYLSNIDKHEYFNYAFDWCKSPDGENFWYEIHYKWVEYLKGV